MTLTRLQAESLLIHVAGPGLIIAGLDGTTVDGTNSSLDEAIIAGLDAIGTDASYWDADPATSLTLTAENRAKFSRSAKLSILELMILRWPPNETEDGASQQWGSLLVQYMQEAERLRREIASRDGVGGATLRAGSIRIGARRGCGSELG